MSTAVLVSYEESLLRAESSLEEVINGELHIMRPVSFRHNRLIRLIQQILDRNLSSDFDLT